MALSITTCIATTTSTMTLSITTFSITLRKRDTQHNYSKHCSQWLYWVSLSWMSFLLRVTIKCTMLNDVILSVVMLTVLAPFRKHYLLPVLVKLLSENNEGFGFCFCFCHKLSIKTTVCLNQGAHQFNFFDSIIREY